MCASRQTHTPPHIRSLNTKRTGSFFIWTGILWCAASLVSSLLSVRLSSVLAATSNRGSVQVQAELWTESGGTKRELKGVDGVDFFGSSLTLVLVDGDQVWGWLTVSRQTTQAGEGAECLRVRDGRKALAWYGTVWCGVVWLALLSETIPSSLAPCASVRTFMRGLFVLGRQAHQWVNEQEQRRSSSMAAVCLHQPVPSYFISSPAHRQPLMS